MIKIKAPNNRIIVFLKNISIHSTLEINILQKRLKNESHHIITVSCSDHFSLDKYMYINKGFNELLLT